MKLNVLFIDTERAPPIWWAWESNKPQFLNYGQILQFGFFTSVQWQFEDETAPSSYDITENEAYFREDPTCDYHVVKKMADLISRADVVVAHNGKRFDWRHFKGRAIYHKIPISHKPYIIDTLSEARTSWFPSNRLGDLAEHLDLAKKQKNEAEIKHLMWGPISDRITHIRKQTEYGIKDIPPLIGLYYDLKPYMERHPHIKSRGVCCKYCGGTRYQNRGVKRLSGLNQYRRWYYCQDCNRQFPGEIYVQ